MKNRFIIKHMNMMLLPLPVTRIIAKHEYEGMVYGRISDFKIGIPQRTIIDFGFNELFVWTGMVTKSGEYLYKQFKKISSLTFKSI